MKIYVTLDAERGVTGCYPEDLFPDPPAGSIEISEDVWREWIADPTQVIGEDLTLQPPALAAQITNKAAAVDMKVAALLLSGAPSGDLHIALDDSSRADMGSMATTALAASSGAVAWPDSYKEGWISIENTRIPLATPADGLQLAAGVGDYYAKLRQNGRTLKDSIMSAADQAALDAIDIESGWPN